MHRLGGGFIYRDGDLEESVGFHKLVDQARDEKVNVGAADRPYLSHIVC